MEFCITMQGQSYGSFIHSIKIRGLYKLNETFKKLWHTIGTREVLTSHRLHQDSHWRSLNPDHRPQHAELENTGADVKGVPEKLKTNEIAT